MFIQTTDIIIYVCPRQTGKTYKLMENAAKSKDHLIICQNRTMSDIIRNSMVSMYGMNSAIGNISFYDPQNENSFSKPYSEETGKIIDDEVRKLVELAYSRVKELLNDKMEAVKIIAEELLKREVLFKDDMERLLGKRPYEDNSPVEDDETSFPENNSTTAA